MFNSKSVLILGRVWGVSIISRRAISCTTVSNGVKAVRFLKSQKKKQVNKANQNRIKNSLDTVDPVLGRKDTPFLVRIMAELKEPKVLVRGYEFGEVEKTLASIEVLKQDKIELSGLGSVAKELSDVGSKVPLASHEAVMRILNMRNADNKTATKKAISLATQEFQRFPGDTGSSEVQAAVMTVRIHNITRHVKENKKDNMNTRILRILVQQRQRILRYLKRDKPERYYWTLEKLGLSDSAVVREFNMDRRYMQDYKFFGDRILIKDSKKVSSEKRSAARKEKKASRYL